MTIGIYAIYFQKLDKIYIGQSQNIEGRLTSHRSLLNRGHYNYKMAEAFLQDSTPEYAILIECDISELNENEIFFINEFDSIRAGLNISYGGNAGVPGYTSGRCKNTREELEIVFNLLTDPTYTKSQILELSNVSKSVLDNIISKKRHIWLHEYYPDISAKVLSNKSNRFQNAQEKRFNTNATLIDVMGNVYKCTNASKFAREHKLNKGHLCAVIRGEEYQHKGWKLKKGGSTDE